MLLRVVLLSPERARSKLHRPAVRGVYRDEYCRGRLLFPLTNHPPMSRGGRAAMFYSPTVDRLDIRTPLLLAPFISRRSYIRFFLGVTLTNSKTYRYHFVKGFLGPLRPLLTTVIAGPNFLQTVVRHDTCGMTKDLEFRWMALSCEIVFVEFVSRQESCFRALRCWLVIV